MGLYCKYSFILCSLHLTIYPGNHSYQLLSSFTDGKTGLKRLNNLPKVTQLARGRAWIQTHAGGLSTLLDVLRLLESFFLQMDISKYFISSSEDKTLKAFTISVASFKTLKHISFPIDGTRDFEGGAQTLPGQTADMNHPSHCCCKEDATGCCAPAPVFIHSAALVLCVSLLSCWNKCPSLWA